MASQKRPLLAQLSSDMAWVCSFAFMNFLIATVASYIVFSNVMSMASAHTISKKMDDTNKKLDALSEKIDALSKTVNGRL